MDIRFIPDGEYDRQRYNSCVHFATNGSIFGYDWYLNNTAREWDLLVEGEYTSVMPLPRRRNWRGRTYLAQPRLVPELAVYSVNALSHKRIQSFWDAIPEQYRGGELTVEPASVPQRPGRFTVTTARGEALLLNRPYAEIIDDFPSGYLRQLARAEAADLIPARPAKPEAIAEFWLAQHGRGRDHEWRFHAMQRLMYQVLHRGWGNGLAVRNRAQDILATAFVVYSHERVFPLFTAESPAGAAAGAATLLWDNLLHQHAGRQLKIKREDLLGNY